MPGQLRVENLIAPRAQARRPVDALQEVGHSTPAAGGEDSLIDVIHALANGFQRPLGAALEVTQPVPADFDHAVTGVTNRSEKGLLMLFALPAQELRIGVLVAWAPAFLQCDGQLELRQMLAGQKAAEVGRGEEELAVQPLHGSVRELESQGGQRRVEALVIAPDGPDSRVGDGLLARTLEDRPVLIVVPEARFVLDAGKSRQATRQGEPVDVVGDLLREAAGGREANGRAVEIANVVVNDPRGHGRAKIGEGPGVADVGIDAGEGGLADGARLQPFSRHDAELVLIRGSIDLAELRDHSGVRPKAREDLGVRSLELGGRVKHTVDALGIVPAVAEGGVGVLRLPGRPRPRVGPAADARDAPRRADALEIAHPPTTKARAAATISGPTSWISPSRRRRAGERSSSCGFSPMNQACVISLLSCWLMNLATRSARRSRGSMAGWRGLRLS